MDDDDNVYLWSASADPDGRFVMSTTSFREARRIAARMQRKMESRFRRAPFPLYGLPPSWEGGRFLGGGGWARTSAERRSTRCPSSTAS